MDSKKAAPKLPRIEILFNSLPTETIEAIMSYLSIDDAAALCDEANLQKDLLRGRADPVLYLSKTFKYSLSLIAVMADEGVALSGSAAQEFILPGSMVQDSDWDWLVPGNARSVTNVLSVLNKCGVQWEWLGDDLDELISGSVGTSKVFLYKHLYNMDKWGSPTNTDYFNKAQRTKDRLKLVKNILASYLTVYIRAMEEELEVADAGQADEADEADEENQADEANQAHQAHTRPLRSRRTIQDDHIIVTKIEADKFDVQKEISETSETSEISENFDSATMPSWPAVINGVVTRGKRREKVQLIICKEKKPLDLINNFYASHTQCFISGWCAVHLFHDISKQKKSILWRKDPDWAVNAAIAKYEARGYEFIAPPDPQVKFPRDRVSAASKGALMVTFDELYDQIAKYGDFEGKINGYEEDLNKYKEIHKTEVDVRKEENERCNEVIARYKRYLQCRKAGLERLSWFIDDDKNLVMDVDKEIKSLRNRPFGKPKKVAIDRERKYNSLRLVKHIASNAPDNVNGILRHPTAIHYDNPEESKFIQDLMTSGVEPMYSSEMWSFLL